MQDFFHQQYVWTIVTSGYIMCSLPPSFHVVFQLFAVLYQAWPRQHAHLSMIEHLGLNFICGSKWDVRSFSLCDNFDVYMRDHSTSKSSSSVSTQKHLHTCSVIHFSCLFLAFDKSCSNKKGDGRFENFRWEN